MSDLPTPNPYTYTTVQKVGFWLLWVLGLLSIIGLVIGAIVIVVLINEYSADGSWGLAGVYVWALIILALIQLGLLIYVMRLYVKHVERAKELLIWTACATFIIPILSLIGFMRFY